jgi:peptidoglycan/xylan/chitin deacetylase (PgdA/CDA1 family)
VVTRPTPGVCPTVPGIVQKPGGTQFYLPCEGTNIALTIDDGPDPLYTPQVLALLAQYQVKATFCMVGFRAEAHPDLVKAAIDGGHHVANHTYSHSLKLNTFVAPQVKDEIARATDILTTASGGHRPTLFRAPGGAMSSIIAAECVAQGLRPVNWSVDPRDWAEPGVQQIVNVILTKTRPGSIILDHDGGGNRQQTVDALRIALPRLIDAGYTFAQV